MHVPMLALLAAVSLAAPPAPTPTIPFEQYQLPNGLNVILSEDHTAPIVAVDVRYDVGSKNEKPGRTGFAHLFEHLMFQGTQNLPKGVADQLIETAGGDSNGSTSQDATNYWQQVPKNALEQALFIESDRMGWMLPVITQEKLDNQRDVVKNERRQNYEMQPYGLAFKTLLENVWDPSFPYHWLPIGSHEDLSAATLEDVKEFFRRYYGPENATLAIVGDIDPAKTKAMVEKYFGPIPRAQKPPQPDAAPQPLTAEKRVTIEDDVQLPRLYVAWQTPKVFSEPDAALDFAADVLSTGKSARLVNRLVMDERIAQAVSAGQMSQELGSMFVVSATPKPGQSPEKLLAEIDEELARLAKTPPTAAELTRAKNRTEAAMIFGLEPVGGFGGRAATLNTYYLLTGDPGFLPKDLARYRGVTADQVRDAVAKYLRKDARVVLTVMPRAGGEGKPPPQGPPLPTQPPGAPTAGAATSAHGGSR
ncbi:MAG TPA: pitrilysin family protein [Anaeromyxobacteraceae bacterium]|nr:pitrilysin family protein [Anaeromyxobacteraceae bacterium]